MKNFYRILSALFLGVICLYSCNVDNTNFEINKNDIFIDSLIIESAKNTFLEEDIKASVINFSRTVSATLPSEATGKEIILSVYLQEGISSSLGSEDAIETGESSFSIYGFGLEEEFQVNLNVLQPFESDKEFVTVWRVNANESITLPLIENGTYNFKVFWGDGESSIVAGYDLESASHTYSEAGDYTVTIWGQLEGINFYSNKTSAKNILDITDWGEVKLGNDEAYFRGCSNLQITADNAPDLSETTTFRAMFRECTSFNSNINHWDVSGIVNMQDLFYKASNYNQPLNNWDVSNVITFETIFTNSAFNQDISNWDVSSATTLKNMFRDCPFNQPIGDWDVSNVTSFQSTFRGNDNFSQDLSGWGDKLGKVVTMREMFRESDYNGDLSAWDMSQVVSMWDMFKDSGFNNPSIANWDLSNMDNLETMFGGENCAFNQDISGWNVSNVVNMQNLFQFNVAFNQDLSSWDVSNVKCNLNFDQGATQWEEQNKPPFLVNSNDNNEFCNRSN